jgi:hypothetical protein
MICLLKQFGTYYPTSSRESFLEVNQPADLRILFKLQTHLNLLRAHHKQARREGSCALAECAVNEHYSFLTDIIYVGFHSTVLQISGPKYLGPHAEQSPSPPTPTSSPRPLTVYPYHLQYHTVSFKIQRAKYSLQSQNVGVIK